MSDNETHLIIRQKIAVITEMVKHTGRIKRKAELYASQK